MTKTVSALLREHYEGILGGMEIQCRLFWREAAPATQVDYPRFAPSLHGGRSRSNLLDPLIRLASLEAFGQVQSILGRTERIPLPTGVSEHISQGAANRCLEEISYAISYLGGQASIGDVKKYFRDASELEAGGDKLTRVSLLECREEMARGDFAPAISLLKRRIVIVRGLFLGGPEPTNPFISIRNGDRVALDAKLIQSEYLLCKSLCQALQALPGKC